jgi:hypothetical protein
MAALLRFEQKREGGIAPNIDALDGVHLKGDFKGHGGPNAPRELLPEARSQRRVSSNPKCACA